MYIYLLRDIGYPSFGLGILLNLIYWVFTTSKNNGFYKIYKHLIGVRANTNFIRISFGFIFPINIGTRETSVSMENLKTNCERKEERKEKETGEVISRTHPSRRVPNW